VRNTTTLPDPAIEPPAPKNVVSNDELYVTGLHLEQYRHATRYPEPYWEEALARDPLDSRCNTALGLVKLSGDNLLKLKRTLDVRFNGKRAETRTSEGDAYYYLASRCNTRNVGRASAAYCKATWNYAWQSAAYYHLAK